MPQIEVEGSYLVCLLMDCPRVYMLDDTVCEAFRVAELAFFDLGTRPELLAAAKRHSDVDVPRILDKFYLWSASESKSSRQCLIDNFFNWIALEYTTSICVPQNLENIFNLLQALRSAGLPEGSKVLDFGCGVGLSARVSGQFPFDVVGVDRSESMSTLARSAGLYVVPWESFLLGPPGLYGGAICSYLFHLLPDNNDLVLLWRSLSAKGIIAANFHKGVGLGMVSQQLECLGAQVEGIDIAESRYSHGPCRLFRRSK